ncbi:MAG: ABC transporter permease [Spirochaetes bacterium]|nr:ABC transporter permease [Spirochaetota bacterium]MBN2771496.1 ABC transporter permease [Spirochaetota bacterium]
MNLRINIITALRALRRNKMRSMLTSIGIIIGISSVIAMMGIGSSAQIAVREMVFSYGANAAKIRLLRGKKVALSDLERIKRFIPQIKYVSPSEHINPRDSRSLHRYKQKKMNPRIEFVGVNYFEIQKRSIIAGRTFTKEEIDQYSKVAIIGTRVRDELFVLEDPIGKQLWINGTTYTVIGILEEKGESFSGDHFDELTLVPFTTGLRRFWNTDSLSNVVVVPYHDEDLALVAEQVKQYYINKFNLITDPDSYFVITSSQDKMQMADDITSALSLLLAGIASISLFVGGVGIMNIMLVSVTERTREIGIRMAIGAKKHDIMLQFLLESIVLSSLGGIVGVLLGLIVYYVMTIITQWPFVFSFISIFISVCFAAAVGIFFGYYPSKKAANLKPIDALRFE